jgi:hypothetical protein
MTNNTTWPKTLAQTLAQNFSAEMEFRRIDP